MRILFAVMFTAQTLAFAAVLSWQVNVPESTPRPELAQEKAPERAPAPEINSLDDLLRTLGD